MTQNAIKQKTTEEKILILKEYLHNENTDDKILALNIFTLIKRNNSFDDSFFTHESIIFNDILEFIDIADGLREDLNAYIKKLLGIYISCIKNCHIVNIDHVETHKIPLVYLYVLYMMDYMTLSMLCNGSQIEDDSNVYEESYEVVLNLSNKISCFSALLENNINTILGGEN